MDNPSGVSILVVGLGNPILGDDGVGWRVTEQLQARLESSPLAYPVDIERLSLGGLSLMEHLIGYTHVIIIDAINSGQNPPGSLSVHRLEDMPERSAGHLSAAHDTSLKNALQVGRTMGAELPSEISIVGIESPFVYDFSEQLSSPVAAAITPAVEQVIAILVRWITPSSNR